MLGEVKDCFAGISRFCFPSITVMTETARPVFVKMLAAAVLTFQTGWRPLVARSPPQRPRAAAAYLSAGTAERTRPARTITVELTTDDASEDGPATDRSPGPVVGRVRRTGAPITVELIVDEPSEGSTADDETGALAQPGRAPLLTREQEFALAREIQTLTQWRRVRSSLAAEAGGEAPSDEVWAAAVGCTSDELQSQLRRSYAARCQLIESNLRLVMSVASMAARRSPQVQLQDVVQDGVLGLMRAADRFEPERGHRFSTYAVWWIRQAVRASLAAQRGALRLPEDFPRRLAALQDGALALQAELGRAPSEVELAERLGLTRQAVVALQTRGRQAAPGASLDALVRGSDGLRRLDSVKSPALGPSAAVSARMRRAEVLAYLEERLTPREAAVVRERFGLGESGASETLARVAEALGISQTRVRQIEARALAKLRDTEPLRWLLADALEEEEEEEAGGDLRRPVGGGGSGGGGGVVEVGSR